jgi:hypothetical protein
MVDMLHGLLLEKLAVLALGVDLHHVIISCWLVESMSECITDD